MSTEPELVFPTDVDLYVSLTKSIMCSRLRSLDRRMLSKLLFHSQDLELQLLMIPIQIGLHRGQIKLKLQQLEPSKLKQVE